MKKMVILFFIPFVLNALMVKHTNENIVIDGTLEKVWYEATPITGFTQSDPDEGKPASEKTEVYLLTDNKNLYVAFKCYTNNRKPQVRLRGWDNTAGDNVTLYLDPFGDRRTGYYFDVSTAGTQGDGTISRGGISIDNSWDGVWFAKSKLTDYGYCVEMKIPFKSIRYSSSDWGVQFAREIPTKGEHDYWKPVPQLPGFRIKQFGELKGITPKVKGQFLEIYPVGLVTYNDKINGSAGLDISYNPSSEFGFNITINPDFAQIEADPFQVNFSKYALYLRERRPFFIEGQNMFKIKQSNNFNIGPGAIKILYTRNIGKIINDSTKIPIYGGLKFSTRGNGFEGTAMYINTGAAGSEPIAHYIALRGAKDILSGILLGITYTGKESARNYTRIGTIDGIYTGKLGDIVTQLSYADSSGTMGFAGYMNYKRLTDKYMAGVYINHLDSNYNINEVGYTTMKGTQLGAAFMPVFHFPIKEIKLCGFGLLGSVSKDAWYSNYSKGIEFFEFINTKNNFNENFSFGITDAYEDTSNIDIHYMARRFNFSFGSNNSRKIYGCIWSGLSYSFNYMANHLGYKSSAGTYLSFKPYSNLLLFSNFSYSIYWYDNTGVGDILRGKNVENSYFIIYPHLSYYFTTKFSMSFESEIVYTGNLHRIYEYRLNPLIVYNISPKSNIYIVYSLTKEYDSESAQFVTSDRGLAFKVRYLLYF